MTLKELRHRFSALYRGVPEFECSPGWLPILHGYSIILSHLANNLDSGSWSRFSVGRIQASNGVFEMEISPPEPQMLVFLKLSQSEARNTCEICGEMGKKTTQKFSNKVLCEECKK